MIHESIVTTMNADGGIHSAPMGVHDHRDGFLLAPFRPSTTLENLKRSGAAVINFTDDVTIFAGCLTGRSEWPTRPAVSVDGGVLEAALAHIEVVVDSVEEDPVRPRFHCRAVHRASHRPFAGFNRAQAAVIEAAILVSRLERLPFDAIEREIAYLRSAVQKTAGEREHLAWAWLMERIEQYRHSLPEETAAR